MALIRREQVGGKLIAMTGDAPALAQADVGVAMNTGTSAAKEAGNMVDLDSNPTKLIEIVEIGKQLLITRGALTTFSIANDVAKYFAIIPAMFASVYRACSTSTSWPCTAHLGDHLQRADHRGPDSTGPARRALQAIPVRCRRRRRHQPPHGPAPPPRRRPLPALWCAAATAPPERRGAGLRARRVHPARTRLHPTTPHLLHHLVRPPRPLPL
ncbi:MULTISPECIES: hypothetical protein [unclassified Streptomyces]|uniref:hypothetical protein n=1 Tax=unclassified Streptomyces TaxID=2593676 RepID=UPI00338D767F